jgi:AbrB family looped-hinge helix DNA binding protein
VSRVTVSSTFQIVIPREIREELDIKPGSTLEVFAERRRIQLVPVGEIRRARGMLSGIDTSIEREEDRR